MGHPTPRPGALTGKRLQYFHREAEQKLRDTRYFAISGTGVPDRHAEIRPAPRCTTHARPVNDKGQRKMYRLALSVLLLSLCANLHIAHAQSPADDACRKSLAALGAATSPPQRTAGCSSEFDALFGVREARSTTPVASVELSEAEQCKHFIERVCIRSYWPEGVIPEGTDVGEFLKDLSPERMGEIRDQVDRLISALPDERPCCPGADEGQEHLL